MPGFKQCSAERYDEMLGVLPPRAMSGWGFLVGEPVTHRVCGMTGATRPTFAAFQRVEGRYYEGPDMTFPEWQELSPGNVLGLWDRLGPCP